MRLNQVRGSRFGIPRKCVLRVVGGRGIGLRFTVVRKVFFSTLLKTPDHPTGFATSSNIRWIAKIRTALTELDGVSNIRWGICEAPAIEPEAAKRGNKVCQS